MNNNQKTEIDIDIDPRIDWSFVDITVKMNLYRIFQEALQNINKYADATTIRIVIAKSETGISIQIFDNGKGFNVTQTKKGIGLKNINTRVGYYAGEMKVVSAPGKGCTLEVFIPN